MTKYIGIRLKNDINICKLYSIHYFSRQFKQITGMSPREYSASIQAMVDDV